MGVEKNVFQYQRQRSSIDDFPCKFPVLLLSYYTFDTINHVILCKKLQKYGLDDNSLGWCRNYLADRKQKVKLNLSCMKSSLCVFYFY